MIVIPAIDLQDGKCVRLYKGNFDDSITYSSSPLQIADKWIKAGTNCLHIIDLDAAKGKGETNAKVISEIVQTYPDITIQLGGGIRSIDKLNYWMDLGIDFPMLGTAAIESFDFLEQCCALYPDKVILALDEKDGHIAVSGWQKTDKLSIGQYIPKVADLPLASILHTDTNRDGTLNGANVALTSKLAQQTEHQVILAGGVESITDVQAAIEAGNIFALILGRALYENRIDLAQAIALTDDKKI